MIDDFAAHFDTKDGRPSQRSARRQDERSIQLS